MVQQCNQEILQKTTELSTIIRAIDFPPADITDAMREELLEVAQHRKHPESTGGLEIDLQICVYQQYDIIANINVEDGPMYGTECTIKYVEKGEHQKGMPVVI